jgi:hypothetical protein
LGVYRITNKEIIAATPDNDRDKCPARFVTPSGINPDLIFCRFMNHWIGECKTIEFGNVNIFGKDVKNEESEFEKIKAKKNKPTLQQLSKQKGSKAAKLQYTKSKTKYLDDHKEGFMEKFKEWKKKQKKKMDE